MAYSTYSEVAEEFKELTLSSTTAIQSTRVTRFITEADAEIDARLSTVYETPVTAGAGALALLRSISVAIVAQRIKDILEVKTGAPTPDQAVRANSATGARKMLEDIVKGKLPLAGATLLSSGDGVSSYATSLECPHEMKKDEVQW